MTQQQGRLRQTFTIQQYSTLVSQFHFNVQVYTLKFDKIVMQSGNSPTIKHTISCH